MLDDSDKDDAREGMTLHNSGIEIKVRVKNSNLDSTSALEESKQEIQRRLKDLLLVEFFTFKIAGQVSNET